MTGKCHSISDSRLRGSVDSICPPAIPLGPSESHAVRDLLAEINRDEVGARAIDTVGLELKVALMAIGGEPGIKRADNSFWLRKCYSLVTRPSVEPLLLAHWNGLKHFEMSEVEMASFCSRLCGSKQQARVRDSYGLWEGADVRFEPPARARSWWRDIQSVASRSELNSLLPAYAFARTIIAHPFHDGNGRLARALVHASLARVADLKAPILPLAPAFYMNAAKLAASLRLLSETGDWKAFGDVFNSVLTHASFLAKRCRQPSTA